MPKNTASMIGALIRARREQAGLDLKTAASRAGVGRRLLLEVETGMRPNVSFTTVIRLLTLFGLEIDVVTRGANRKGLTAAESSTTR